MDRRTFLKIAGTGSAAFVAGCNSHPQRKLYTLVQAPEDMVTGVATYYASTCRECPAGCGVLAKNREGRVIKLEGNPLHPVNQGKLCARGQAALQGLYNPDRLTKPLVKIDGRWTETSFAQASDLLRKQLIGAATLGPNRIGMLTETVGKSLLGIFEAVLTQHQSQGPLTYEPFAFESLKFAHQTVFGQPILPGYRLDQADVVVGFGADFLDTWLSPVEYARKFKAMHSIANGHKGRFFHIGSHQSLTAVNADRWIACRPGTETLIVLALIQIALQRRRGSDLSKAFRTDLGRLAEKYPIEKIIKISGIAKEDIEQIGQYLFKARRPLVLPTATTAGGPASAAADLATVMLNALLDPNFALYDFDQRHRVEIAHSRAAVQRLLEPNPQHPLSVLLLNNVNPVYSLPASDVLEKRFAGGGLFVVSFTNFMDETAAAADLIFPIQLPLESWDAYESKQAMTATLQPAAGKITDAPNIGDIFLQLFPSAMRPAADYHQYIARQLIEREKIATQQEWLGVIQSGGRFVADKPATQPILAFNAETVAKLEGLIKKNPWPDPQQTVVQVIPSLRFYDGRNANRPWLPEIPDAVTQVAWQTVALVPAQTMSVRNWVDGTVVGLATDQGQIELPVYRNDGLLPGTVVVPLGQGHSQLGRYARQQGVNPVVLLSPDTELFSGTPSYTAVLTSFESIGQKQPLARTSGSRFELGRKIALTIPLKDARKARSISEDLTMNDFPLTLPLPEGYDHKRDIYPPHAHEGYRWGMVVDLDRCIGCSACAVACYAENNIGVVGEQHIIEGREMAWLRIERYQDPGDPTKLIFLPMMCQHCDNAPCESVCPVYAPHHSKEGLNNQIYNRCIGTRFCGQNCPYKVRRFNWFDWQWPEPLNMQLNPNVTVRSKGVMEKCSFCIQRIKEGHDKAKNENRPIRDGEIIPACAQTCPTDALMFGNLMDPDSAVRRLVKDPRAYQIMGYLNTKPAVIYLKKVVS